MIYIYRLENFRSIDTIDIKMNNYITITGDNSTILKDICGGFDYYFSEKKLTKDDKEINDKKLTLTDFMSGEKIQVSASEIVFLENNSLEDELELGSKTVLHSIVNEFLKEKLSMEPSLITLNAIIKDFEFEESMEELKSVISRYSDYRLSFNFEEFTAADIGKKITVKFVNEDIEINGYKISNFEKLKIKTGIMEKQCGIIKNRIYIFYYPENNLTVKEQKALKTFLLELSRNSIVIIATSSKYLLSSTSLDTLNIYIADKLKNSMKEDELLEIVSENYPVLKKKEEISEEVKFSVFNYISDVLNDFTITNKKIFDENIVFIDDYESIFNLMFYLKLSGINYKADIKYNDDSVFSNYIKNNLIN